MHTSAYVSEHTQLEILVKPLLVENIIKLETTRSKRLRGPAVLLFVIGNLKKRNPILFAVPQILGFVCFLKSSSGYDKKIAGLNSLLKKKHTQSRISDIEAQQRLK
jgi:hypothetical protein